MDRIDIEAQTRITQLEAELERAKDRLKSVEGEMAGYKAQLLLMKADSCFDGWYTFLVPSH